MDGAICMNPLYIVHEWAGHINKSEQDFVYKTWSCDPEPCTLSTVQLCHLHNLPKSSTPPQKHVFLPVSPMLSSSAFSFIALDGVEVDCILLANCAKVFCANYGTGIWGELAGPSLAGIIYFSLF